MKALGYVLFAALVPVFGCGAPEDALDTVRAEEQLRSQEQGLARRLTVGPENVEILRFGCYDESSPPRLRWNCLDAANDLDGSHLNTLCKRQIGANDTELGTNGGSCDYNGQCVDFVKAITRDHDPTSSWIQGDNVIVAGTANPGDAIATFTSGRYDMGHTGIFMSYLRNSAGAIIGFRMADMNWGTNAVTKHEFYRTGSGTSDADRYSFIRVND